MKLATRKKSAKKQKQSVKFNVQWLILILASFLMIAFVYFKQGKIGNEISLALGGIFGFIKYFLPVAMLVFTIFMIAENEKKVTSKVFVFFLFFLMINIVLATYQISNGNINPTDKMSDILSKGYELGTRDIGGGAFGTLFAVPAVRAIGAIGTSILCFGIMLIIIIIAFKINVVGDVIEFKENLSEHRARNKELAMQNEKKTQKLIKEQKVKEDSARQITSMSNEEVNNRPKKSKGIFSVFTKYYDDNDVAGIKKESAIMKNIATSTDVDYGDSLVQDDGDFEDEININLPLSKNSDGGSEQLEIPNMKTNTGRKTINKFDNNVEKNNKVSEDVSPESLGLNDSTLNVAEDHYEFPPINILADIGENEDGDIRKRILATSEKLRKTLQSFGVSAKVENVSVGPVITRFEIAPAEGVRVSKISNLADDIALSLEAESIRIEAPIPGKHTVGIEIPRKNKSIVGLKDIIESDEFEEAKSKLAFALGKDVAGDAVVTDIAKMPHVLIAGSTGSGKSVCINTLITSIIYKAKPSEVKLLMIDPKVVELSVYNGIPHLLIPVVTDPKKAAGALAWAVQEMVSRYSKFAEKKVRDIKGYNQQAEERGEPTMPQMVIIIDELADLMMVAAKEVEDAICRLAQMARAAGMHLVIATQRPSVDVITGIIKANIPSRIAFAVSSQVDSRTILDSAGAEKLLGKGDMLFFPIGASKPTRVQGAFVSDSEVENIVKYIKTDEINENSTSILEKIDNIDNPVNNVSDDEDDDNDPLLEEAIEEVIRNQTASTSFIQRKFKVGYARAGRIIDQMEQRGIVSGFQGSKPRDVLMSKERWNELKSAPGAENSTSDE